VGSLPEETCEYQSERDQPTQTWTLIQNGRASPGISSNRSPKALKDDNSGDCSTERQSASAVTCGRGHYADNSSHSQRALTSRLSGLLFV
jgi:hypothetical protein